LPGRRAWRASEEYAARILEEMGYKILGYHVPVRVEGVDVSEVDILAEKDGEKYAVEVKAGSLDVAGVRQAYVNAVLLGAKPLIIARGADEPARAVAERLGVELILLPDLLVAGFDDLREAVREALEAAVDSLLDYVARCREAGPEDLQVMAALASSDTFSDAAARLGVDEAGLARMIAGLRRRGLLPSGPFRRLRLASKMILACRSLLESSRG